MITCSLLKKMYGSEVGLATMDLQIPTGKVVGVLGENGAGKTTLLKLMAGLLQPDSGEVRVDGKLPRERLEDIAFMTEAGSWFPGWHAWQHVRFYETFLPRFDRERFLKLMYFFRIPLDKRAGKMSTGEQAKLEIALGFSKGAHILLMDEPFLGKDIFARRDFLQMMAAGLHEDETVLISTHMVEEIESFLDRAVVLRCGRLKADVMLDDLREKGGTLVELLAAACEYDSERVYHYL